MGSTSRLSQQCQKCRYKDTCDHKQMEMLAYIDEPPIQAQNSQSITSNLAQPIMRETTTIAINGVKTIVYKDDLEKMFDIVSKQITAELRGGK